ncbi:reverse transcriptase domain-containing protein [Tanacetum coccineum]
MVISIENKSKVRNSRNKLIVSQVKASNVDFSEIASAVASVVTSVMTAMFKQHQVTPAPAFVKAVEESCVTCGGAHSYRQCPATDGNTFSGYQDNIQGYVSAYAEHLLLTEYGDLKAITTRSGISYDGPPIPPPSSSLPKVVEREPEVTKDTMQPSTKNIQPPVVQIQAPIDEPVVAPKPKPSIPYPSRANKQKLHEKDDNLALKFVEIFRELHFELSFADALLYMPIFASMFKSLLNNKEKLFDLAKTLVNENCSAVILKKLPEKLGDPGKFLIPCDFPELVECLALADLGASINLMPLSIWKKLSLPELTPTQMILELADRSTTSPLVLRCCLCKSRKVPFSGRLLDDEAITFKVGSKLRGYSYNVLCRLIVLIVIDVACEEYAQEVLRFSDSSTSGNPTPSLDPILSTSSPSLTPFEEGDFILEEIEACLTNDSIPPGIDDDNFNPEGDLLLLEKLLNDDPSSIPPVGTFSVRKLKSFSYSKNLMSLFVIKKGAENLAADPLSRLENPHQSDLEKKEIMETFPLETLGMVAFRGDDSTPWFADFSNYHVGNFLAIMGPPGDIIVPTTPPRKFLTQDSIGPIFTEMPMTWSHSVTLVNVKAKSRKKMKCPKMQFKIAPDFEASRAYGFVLRSLELQSLARLWESNILNLID